MLYVMFWCIFVMANTDGILNSPCIVVSRLCLVMHVISWRNRETVLTLFFKTPVICGKSLHWFTFPSSHAETQNAYDWLKFASTPQKCFAYIVLHCVQYTLRQSRRHRNYQVKLTYIFNDFKDADVLLKILYTGFCFMWETTIKSRE